MKKPHHKVKEKPKRGKAILVFLFGIAWGILLMSYIHFIYFPDPIFTVENVLKMQNIYAQHVL